MTTIRVDTSAARTLGIVSSEDFLKRSRDTPPRRKSSLAFVSWSTWPRIWSRHDVASVIWIERDSLLRDPSPSTDDDPSATLAAVAHKYRGLDVGSDGSRMAEGFREDLDDFAEPRRRALRLLL